MLRSKDDGSNANQYYVYLNVKKCFAYILLLMVSFAVAQTPITYTTKNGLPSNLVYDIVEDGNGFIWFATNRGIAKFDGKNFKVFTTKDGLPNNDTWLLETDAQGRVWFFSKSKYQGYVENDVLHVLKTENNEVINLAYVDKNYNPFILVSSGFTYEPVGTKLKIKSNIVRDPSYLSSIFEDYITGNQSIVLRNGPKMPTLYFKKDSLLTLDEDNNTINSFTLNTPLAYENSIRSNPITTGSGKFILCNKSGITQYDNDTKTVTTYPLSKTALQRYSRANRVYLSNNVTQISLNGFNYLFDATFNLKNKIDVQKIVPDVQKSFVDSRGHLWV